MIYLDNAATSFPKPESVYQALDTFARSHLANPGRAGHTMALAARITLTRLRVGSDGTLDPDDVRKALTPRTRLVAMTHASNVLGTVQPVAEVGRITRERDVLLLVDAAQTAGVVPIDVQALN